MDGNLQNLFPNLLRDRSGYQVSALAALPDKDSRRALAGFSHGTGSCHPIMLFNVDNGEVLSTFTHHTKWVRCLAVAPDGHHFASGSDDTTVRIVKLPPQNTK